MTSEAIVKKARDYLINGKIKVERLTPREAFVTAKGSKTYDLYWHPGTGWICDCPAGRNQIDCAHIFASKLITNLASHETVSILGSDPSYEFQQLLAG